MTAAAMKSLQARVIVLLSRGTPMTMTEIVKAMSPTEVDVKQALVALKNAGRITVGDGWRWSAVSTAETK